jgi:hypothetical protein
MRLFKIAIASLPLLLAAPLFAQPEAGDETSDRPETTGPVDTAPEHERLAADARAKLAAGDTAAACALFEKSDNLEPNEDVKFEHAQCLEKNGDAAPAAAVYEKVAAAGGARANEAKRRAEALRESLNPKPSTQPGPVADDSSKDEPTPAEVPAVMLPEEKEANHYHFSDFMDTRLTWTFADDDVLHATGEVTPVSPSISVGDRRRYRLFFDSLNSQFGGRENLTHLVLYKKMPGFIDNVGTEASLVLRFDLASLASGSNNLNSSLYDAGSFIRIWYDFGKEENASSLGVTLFPIDTDRFRLGYLYDISWGGTNARSNQSIFPRIQGSAPGFKLQFDHEYFYLFGGMKTATIVQPEEILTPGTSEVEVVRVGETNYGALGGAGVKITDYANFDVGTGWFQQGKFDLPDVLGAAVYTFGFSGRASIHDADTNVGNSADFSLYRNDPMKADKLLGPQAYDPDKLSWKLTVEYANLFQNLKDFDQPGETKLQQARAAAAQATIKYGYFQTTLSGIYRDLPFVLRNVPSFVPFETLPQEADVAGEFFVAAAADYHFDGPRLTPGVGFGVQFPSTFTTTSVIVNGDEIGRTVVIRQQGDQSILPQDKNAVPIIQARASLRWDISPMLNTVGWMQFIRDNNATFVERDPNEGTVALRDFLSPNFLGFGTSFQARF